MTTGRGHPRHRVVRSIGHRRGANPEHRLHIPWPPKRPVALRSRVRHPPDGARDRTDADNNVSQFGYDEFGNVTTVTQSNLAAGTSSSTSFDYNMFGDLVTRLSRTVYDDAGRAERTGQYSGVDIDIVGQATGLSSVLASSGTLVSFSSTTYDDDTNRVTQSIDSHGRRTQTLHGRFGDVVESRRETVYDPYGQTSIQRSGLARIVAPDGTPVSIDDSDLIETHHQYDAFGNATRTEWHSESGPHRYTLTRCDDENRPVAEMQQTDALVEASWSASEESFVVSAVPDPDNAGTLTRPTYEYAYDEQGNQTFIRDPLGHETRFTFTDRGMQATRTLPLGDDGILGTADDTTAIYQYDHTQQTDKAVYTTLLDDATINSLADGGDGNCSRLLRRNPKPLAAGEPLYLVQPSGYRHKL